MKWGHATMLWWSEVGAASPDGLWPQTIIIRLHIHWWIVCVVYTWCVHPPIIYEGTEAMGNIPPIMLCRRLLSDLHCAYIILSRFITEGSRWWQRGGLPCYLSTIIITTFLWVSMIYVCHVDGTVRIWSDTSLMNTYILYVNNESIVGYIL